MPSAKPHLCQRAHAGDFGGHITPTSAPKKYTNVAHRRSRTISIGHHEQIAGAPPALSVLWFVSLPPIAWRRAIGIAPDGQSQKTSPAMMA